MVEISMLEVMEDFVVATSTFSAIILPSTCFNSGITVIFTVGPGTTENATFSCLIFALHFPQSVKRLLARTLPSLVLNLWFCLQTGQGHN